MCTLLNQLLANVDLAVDRGPNNRRLMNALKDSRLQCLTAEIDYSYEERRKLSIDHICVSESLAASSPVFLIPDESRKCSDHRRVVAAAAHSQLQQINRRDGCQRRRKLQRKKTRLVSEFLAAIGSRRTRLPEAGRPSTVARYARASLRPQACSRCLSPPECPLPL
jgi:hypothetical protein